VLPPNRPTRAVYESALTQPLAIRDQIRRYVKEHGIIALAFPPITIPPPKIGAMEDITVGGKKVPLDFAMYRNTALGSCASLASLVVPAGITSNGLPVGLEFDALNGNDRALLALGLSIEKVLGPLPRPPLS
jgi:indoleacetamide hydrolase